MFTMKVFLSFHNSSPVQEMKPGLFEATPVFIFMTSRLLLYESSQNLNILFNTWILYTFILVLDYLITRSLM